MDRILIFAVLAICFLQSCSGSKNAINGGSTFENSYVRIDNTKTLSSDKKKSHLIHKNGTPFFVEELSSVENLPVSIKSRFAQSFKSYHYHKFFELVHLDGKVHKMFRDSVLIVDVAKASMNVEGHQLLECRPCNAKAIILFKNRKFVYPVTISESWFVENANFSFITGASQNMYPSIRYDGKTQNQPSGFYFKVANRKFIHIYVNETTSSFDDIVTSVRFFRR